MHARIILAVGLVIAGSAAGVLALAGRAIPAAEQTVPVQRAKTEQGSKNGICIDVVIENVDFSANTVTAVSTVYVLPPHDNAGGQIFMTGTTGSQRERATEYVRLPVMPEARLQKKKPKAGMHAIIRLEQLRHGAMVVTEIKEFTDAERIGVDAIDAPGAMSDGTR